VRAGRPRLVDEESAGHATAPGCEWARRVAVRVEQCVRPAMVAAPLTTQARGPGPGSSVKIMRHRAKLGRRLVRGLARRRCRAELGLAPTRLESPGAGSPTSGLVGGDADPADA
jgi:hypothetical protein